MADIEPASNDPASEAELRALAGVWWLGAGLAAALIVCAVALLPSDHSELILALVVVAAGVALGGMRRMGIAAPLLVLFGVLAAFVGTERFDDAPGVAISVALAGAAAALMSGQLNRRGVRIRSELLTLHARAERRTIRDAVEEAMSRRRQQHFLDREFSRAQRYDREVTVAAADVDNIELLRREQGPEAVEKVLVALGELFAADTRLPDGGVSDELRLLFVLPETPLMGGRTVAERVRLAFRQMRLTGADGVPLTVSIGVAAYPTDGERGEEVLAAATSALQRASAMGGNRTVLHSIPAGAPDGWAGTSTD